MANENKFKEFPVDRNNEPIMSSPAPHLVMITDTEAWVDVIVPEDKECKALLAVVHSGDPTNFNNTALGLEFFWRPSTDYDGQWVPLTSGPLPFCAKGGGALGQAYLQAGTALSLIML